MSDEQIRRQEDDTEGHRMMFSDQGLKGDIEPTEFGDDDDTEGHRMLYSDQGLKGDIEPTEFADDDTATPSGEDRTE